MQKCNDLIIIISVPKCIMKCCMSAVGGCWVTSVSSVCKNKRKKVPFRFVVRGSCCSGNYSPNYCTTWQPTIIDRVEFSKAFEINIRNVSKNMKSMLANRGPAVWKWHALNESIIILQLTHNDFVPNLGCFTLSIRKLIFPLSSINSNYDYPTHFTTSHLDQLYSTSWSILCFL
jgi:hypothetical protein